MRQQLRCVHGGRSRSGHTELSETCPPVHLSPRPGQSSLAGWAEPRDLAGQWLRCSINNSPAWSPCSLWKLVENENLRTLRRTVPGVGHLVLPTLHRCLSNSTGRPWL
ncbi:hypothetical protein GHT09_010310 [Marmota monax]|uniref:Uncharacterized protein n=1 Tax=Marmota monax TaxID=9995 RepID=A0A834V0A7_MARMO|nr:hypothetical protein GHT09_010310 [Marmota monax]